MFVLHYINTAETQTIHLVIDKQIWLYSSKKILSTDEAESEIKLPRRMCLAGTQQIQKLYGILI